MSLKAKREAQLSQTAASLVEQLMGAAPAVLEPPAAEPAPQPEPATLTPEQMAQAYAPITMSNEAVMAPTPTVVTEQFVTIPPTPAPEPPKRGRPKKAPPHDTTSAGALLAGEQPLDIKSVAIESVQFEPDAELQIALACINNQFDVRDMIAFLQAWRRRYNT